MKKGKVFFHPIDGSGPLTISWSSRPKGDAIEAAKGAGVGFFSEQGDLLCVIFDDVQSDQDHQILEFESISVDIFVKNNLVEHAITQNKSASSPLRKRRKTKKPQV